MQAQKLLMLTIWACLWTGHNLKTNLCPRRAGGAPKVPNVALFVVGVVGHVGAQSGLARFPAGDVVVNVWQSLHEGSCVIVVELAETAWK